MSLWGWLLLASVAAYATKLSGYLVPGRFLESARMTRVAGTLTIGLLAALTAVNAFGAERALALDARALALIVAAIALALRVPYLGVVVAGAGAAALARFSGIG